MSLSTDEQKAIAAYGAIQAFIAKNPKTSVLIAFAAGAALGATGVLGLILRLI